MQNNGIYQKEGSITAKSIAVGQGASINETIYNTENSHNDGRSKEEIDNSASIFFSYAWGNDGEKIVDDLYDSLKRDGLTLVRDKMDLGYKGLITGFMEGIGRGKVVIVCITDKYLKSEYCMFELYELFRNCRFNKQELLERMFPLKVDNINLSRPSVIGSYINHWNVMQKEWEDLVTVEATKIAPEQQVRYGRIKKISTELGSLLDLLADINLLTIEKLVSDDYREIKLALESRIKV